MKVTIIGMGWIGLPLAKKLVMDGHRVIGTVTSEEKRRRITDEGIECWVLNSDNSQISTKIIEQTESLIVTIPPFPPSEEYAQYLLKIVNQFGEVPLLYTSSIGVYEGYGEFKEDSSQLLNIHPVRQAEKVLTEYNCNTTLVRLGGLFGPNRHPIKFLAGRTFNKPDTHINFIHLNDAVGIIAALIEQPLDGVVNAVYPEFPSKSDYYTKAALHYKLPIPDFSNAEQKERRIYSERVTKELNYKFLESIWNFPAF